MSTQPITSASYKPYHGGRTERSIMLSSSIIAIMLMQKKIQEHQRRRRFFDAAGLSIRANDRSIRNAGGGPC